MCQTIKHFGIALLLALGFLTTSAQPEVLTLTASHEAARKAFPGMAQMKALSESHRLALENIRSTFLPKSQLNVSASYQSDVTSLNINIPMITPDEMPKDSYKATFDVNQLLYDGGANKARRAAQMVQHEVDNQFVEAEFYKVKELVNDLFFAVIMGRKTREQLSLGLSNLEARRKNAASAVDNGMMLTSSLQLIDVEIALQQQRLAEVEHSVAAALAMLSVWTGQPVRGETVLELPSVLPEPMSDVNLRPELALFGLQQQKLDFMSRQTAARMLPVVTGFGQAGYGRPGLNMLNSQFDTWYIVGIKAQWNFWDWKQTFRERAQVRLQQEVLGTQQSAYTQRLASQLTALRSEMEKAGDLLNQDRQIIAMREKIRISAVSQFENGTLDAADLIARTNEETLAKTSYEIHKLQLVQYQIKYMTLLGQQ